MKRHPLAAYFILTLVISWAFWVPMVLAVHGKITLSNPKLPLLLWNWGAFGPFFAALIVSFAGGGMNGLQNLLGRFLIWRVGAGWYLVALGMPAALSLLMIAGHMMFGGEAPDFTHPPIYDKQLGGFYQEYNAWTILVPFFLHNLLLGIGGDVGNTPIGEETGWRGFALPHLQTRFNALASSILIGLAWAVWRLPTALIEDETTAVPYYLIALGVVPGAILTTWIFNNSGGSMLLVLLYANSIKLTGWFLPSPGGMSFGIVITVLWAAAVALVTLWGPERLSRKELQDRCWEPDRSDHVPVVQNLPPGQGLIS